MSRLDAELVRFVPKALIEGEEDDEEEEEQQQQQQQQQRRQQQQQEEKIAMHEKECQLLC